MLFWQDGQLSVGDQILEVGDKPLTGVHYEKVSIDQRSKVLKIPVYSYKFTSFFLLPLCNFIMIIWIIFFFFSGNRNLKTNARNNQT